MAEFAMLADTADVLPRGGHPSTARHGTGQGMFAGQRPTFYPLVHATNKKPDVTPDRLIIDSKKLSQAVDEFSKQLTACAKA